MFKIHDLWGIIAGVLFLIFIYLILKNSGPFVNVTKQGSTSAVGLIKGLQGR